MSLTSALGRQRQVDFCKFEVSLVFQASSRTATDGCYTEKPCLEKTSNQKTTTKPNKKGDMRFLE